MIKNSDERTFVAFDLGAESGRTILGTLRRRQLALRQLSRFQNEMVSIDGHLHWDIHRLFEQMKLGLSACGPAGARPTSIGVDTWGVDFGLFGPDGLALELPYSYRDRRTDGIMEEFFKLMPRERVYELTGIQFMKLNSLFQLFAQKRQRPALLEKASRLLFMPDIFNYFLTGVARTEFTFATTSQLYNPRAKTWEPKLFAALEVPQAIMQEIAPPGTVLGKIEKTVEEQNSVGDVSVVAVASHDTGSAIAAIPAEGDDWLYISSGTWSLMGIETREPIISREALEMNFTNEGGVEGTFRFLKNITGLWLLRQCRKAWSEEQHYSYDDLTNLIGRAAPFRFLIDTDDPAFFNPPSMPDAIRKYCTETNQPSPESHAEFVRCILESLALKYRATLDQLRRLNPRAMARIHLIGGGAQNGVLCQFTANATALPVLVGPIEATATGNIMVQALAAGEVQSLAEMREIIRSSFVPVSYSPREVEAWESAYVRYKEVTGI